MAENIYTDGPEQIIPADTYVNTDPDRYVKLRIPKSGTAFETIKPISIPGLLERTATRFPDTVAMAKKVDEKWEKITYKEYLAQVRTVAKAFISLGLERAHAVCILGFNNPEWFIADLAAIFAGGIAGGIYTTNSPEACFYCLENSRANIAVVEDEKQLEKILQIKSRLANLKAIIQYTGEPKHPDVISWKKLLEIGNQQPDDKLNETLKKIAVNQCCTLIYTSGTVGDPKGVMLSHDNLTWNALSDFHRLSMTAGNFEVLVSYLPLSHIAAQIVDIYLSITAAMSVYFADRDALKGSLLNTLKEVQPTRFFAVPRVYEKIYEQMLKVAAAGGLVQQMISGWAKKQALQHHLDAINGVKSDTWAYRIARNVLLSRVKEALGFSRCNIFHSAGAPLSRKVQMYFYGLDIPVMDSYGMSEAAGGHAVSIEGATNFDSVGSALPGMKTKLHNKVNGEGELCLYGRHVFMGYLNDKEKTDEALDADGYLHTGDLGRIDEQGLIYITGRLKELLITAGGENIPPLIIEAQLKSELPHISNAFLVGDRRKFISVLVTLKTELDPDSGVPSNKLLPSVQEWLSNLGCPAMTVQQILEAGPHKNLLEELRQAIERVNHKSTSNAQTIKKIAILPADFSIPTGELGPTMKVKRRIVEEKYLDLIEKFYSDN